VGTNSQTLYQSIFEAKHKQIAVLVDPDKHTEESLQKLCNNINQSKVDFILVGGSLLLKNNFDSTIEYLKQHTKLPVIIFPGSNFQVSDKADAILFLSLVSGRNPEYLIGQHVTAAPLIKASNIEVIPTAYLLIDGGRISSTSYITQTVPIPNNKPDIAVATALAAEMLGMKIIYLEAGSGAENTVSQELIKAVKTAVKIPVIVGGGIRTASSAKDIFDAGADIIVVGNALEDNADLLISF
jgi:phosphoglycerol geranylgeranyltransferase